MLRELYVDNLVLIDQMRIEFGPGLNVLSGETGAGKSLVMDALGFLTGARVSSELVRDPSRRAVIEGVFTLPPESPLREYLEEQGLLEQGDDVLVLRREFGETARNVVRINGRAVSLGQLKTLGEQLVDIHLQHDSQLLLHPRMYLSFLDSFDASIPALTREVAAVFEAWQSAREELERRRREERERAREVEYLEFQVQEIEAAQLVPGEEEALRARRERLRNAEDLRLAAETVTRLTYAGEGDVAAYDLVAAALEAARRQSRDPFFSEMVGLLEGCLFALEDCGIRAGQFARELGIDPTELQEVEERLETVIRLQRKYGEGIEQVLGYLRQAQQRLEELRADEERATALEADARVLAERYRELARELSARRQQARLLLEDQVHAGLVQLGMPDVRLQVLVTPREAPARDGMDQVTFLFAANPGEEPRPLARVASGGELSRLILAMKKALARVYRVPTLIFDEIDVGVGGSALNAMARVLAELSTTHQVVLVTHSPQVASYADTHYLLEKRSAGGRVTTAARRLEGQEREREIARMMAGEAYSPVTLEHAREMLARARQERNR